MLEFFSDKYKMTLDEKEGPMILITENGQPTQKMIKDIEDNDTIYSEYEERVIEDIRHSLKNHGGDGSTYTPEQKN